MKLDLGQKTEEFSQTAGALAPGTAILADRVLAGALRPRGGPTASVDPDRAPEPEVEAPETDDE